MSYFTIDELHIASPCDVPWSSMEGTSTVKHCQDCNKNVYNLSLLTRAEANNLIIEKEGQLCVQLYKRFDGTVLTADCPKGLRMLKKHYLRSRAKVVALAVAVAALFGMSISMSSCWGTPMGVPTSPKSDTTHHG